MEKQRLPVGIEEFDEIRRENFYYVDKTSLIRELLVRWGKVNLFTRPRRFGKSLNMSMLKYFFEIGCDKEIFEGLDISKEKEFCDKYMGRFPVISITLKNVEGMDYVSARNALINQIGNEALRFEFLRESDRLSETEKLKYSQLIKISAGTGESAVYAMAESVLADSLKTLTQLLSRHYGVKAILLIDEYDVPLDKASRSGYYAEMVSLLRNLFGNALKTNPALQFAVLTGCLRVAKESIFTGLNNLKIFSITDSECDSCFGFTDAEVRDMLDYYGVSDRYEAVRDWYDGYQFGDAEVYCPWDVINYVDRLQGKKLLSPQNYWSNTSGNDAVRYLISKLGGGVLKSEMETLISGETVEKEIHEDLTYDEIYSSVDNVWSLLLMTGYLTQRGQVWGNRLNLAIPNLEIRNIFTDQILAMFTDDVARDGDLLRSFCAALENGEALEVERLFTEYLRKTISIRDTFARRPAKENFYHGVLLGILGYKDGWILQSNKESGNGYSDISVIIEEKEIGIIIEVKYSGDRRPETVCREAVAQIERKRYAEELKRKNCHTVLAYGIACYKKECRVMAKNISLSLQ